MNRRCSHCGSTNVRRSGRLGSEAGTYPFHSPYRCHDCDRRFWVLSRKTLFGIYKIVGDELTMADYYLLPSLFGFGLTPEGKQLLPKFPAVVAWDNRMDALPTVVRFNASLPPRAPIQHAREWVHHHRPAA